MTKTLNISCQYGYRLQLRAFSQLFVGISHTTHLATGRGSTGIVPHSSIEGSPSSSRASIAMRIVFIRSSARNSMDVQLEHANEVPDPRHWSGGEGYTFRFSVKGRTLTIKRIDEDGGWGAYFSLRVYLPTEDILDFTSTC